MMYVEFMKILGLRRPKSSLTAHELARIGEKNIFHELEVDHFKKVGILLFGLRKPR